MGQEVTDLPARVAPQIGVAPPTGWNVLPRNWVTQMQLSTPFTMFSRSGETPAQRRGVEAEPGQRARPEVGQEDVRGREQLVEHRAARLGAQVEGDGPLAAVGERDRQVDAAAVRADALGGQAAVGLAFQALDPDDVRAPVRQQRTGDGHEHPLCQLDDAVSRAGSAARPKAALFALPRRPVLSRRRPGRPRASTAPRPRDACDHEACDTLKVNPAITTDLLTRIGTAVADWDSLALVLADPD